MPLLPRAGVPRPGLAPWPRLPVASSAPSPALHGFESDAAQGQAVTVGRQVLRFVPGGQTQAVSDARAGARTLSAAQGQTPVQALTPARSTAAAQGAPGTVARQSAIPAAASQPQASALGRQLARNVAVAQPQTATASLQATRTVVATQAQSATSAQGIRHPVTATAPQAQAVSQTLQVAALVIAGNLIADASGNGYTGTLANGAYGVGSPWTGFLEAVRFVAASESYLDAGTALAIPTPFCFEAKLQLVSAPVSGSGAIAMKDGSAASTLFLRVQTDLSVAWRVAAVNNSSNSNVLDIGNKHDIAISWDGSNIRVFVDGALVGQSAFAGPLANDSSFSFRIGRATSVTPNALDAVVDEVRLSSAARYTAAYTPSSSPFTADSNTVALWHMNPGQGQSVSVSRQAARTASVGQGQNATVARRAARTASVGQAQASSQSLALARALSIPQAAAVALTRGAARVAAPSQAQAGSATAALARTAAASQAQTASRVRSLQKTVIAGVFIADASGNGHDGTITSALAGRAADASGVASPWSGFGSATYFAGAAVNVGAVGVGTHFCIEGKFQLDPAGLALGALIARWGAGAQADSSFSIYVQEVQGSILNAKVRTSAGTIALSIPGSPLTANTPHDFALDYDGTTLRLFLDGVLGDSAAVAALSQPNATTPTLLGAIYGFGPPYLQSLTGILEEVRISSASRYTATYTPATSPFTPDSSTTALWHMALGQQQLPTVARSVQRSQAAAQAQPGMELLALARSFALQQAGNQSIARALAQNETAITTLVVSVRLAGSRTAVSAQAASSKAVAQLGAVIGAVQVQVANANGQQSLTRIATQATAGSSTLSASRSAASGQGQGASAATGIGRTAACSQSCTGSALRGVARLLVTAAAQSSTIVEQLARTVKATQATSGSAAAQTGSSGVTINVTQANAPTVVLRLGVTHTAGQGISPVSGRSLGLSISHGQGQNPVQQWALARNVSCSQPQTPTTNGSVPRTHAVTQSSAAFEARAVRRAVQVGQGQSSSVSLPGRARLLAVVQSQQVRLSRASSRAVSGSQSTGGSTTLSLYRGAVAAQGSSSQIVPARGWAFTATQPTSVTVTFTTIIPTPGEVSLLDYAATVLQLGDHSTAIVTVGDDAAAAQLADEATGGTLLDENSTVPALQDWF